MTGERGEAQPGREVELCPECGGATPETGACWSRVDELLEMESRALGGHDPEVAKRAHFFAIAAYQLQHPSRLTADAVTSLRDAVGEMLAHSRPMDDLRRDIGRRVAGPTRVARRADPCDRTHVDPRWPRRWTMTALDVIAGGDDAYVSRVTAWASAAIGDLDRALAH